METIVDLFRRLDCSSLHVMRLCGRTIISVRCASEDAAVTASDLLGAGRIETDADGQVSAYLATPEVSIHVDGPAAAQGVA